MEVPICFYFSVGTEFGHTEVFFFKTREAAEAEYDRMFEENEGEFYFDRGYVSVLFQSDIQ